MPTVKLCAATILGAFEEAQTELVGKAVVLTDGIAGTVENIWLDELHGLRISIGVTSESGQSQLSNSCRARFEEMGTRVRATLAKKRPAGEPRPSRQASSGLAYRRCELAWVNGEEIGVNFLKTGKQARRAKTEPG
jgi:hypothetical protein